MTELAISQTVKIIGLAISTVLEMLLAVEPHGGFPKIGDPNIVP